MSSQGSDNRYHESLIHLIREMTDVARKLKAFNDASETDPGTAEVPIVEPFPQTGLREIDAVANMFSVTYRVFSRHVSRLHELLAAREVAATKGRATVLACGVSDQTTALFGEDAPAVMETLARYALLMATVVERRGGTFVMRGGASFVATFGEEQDSGERSAVRACHAGLEALAALDQFNTYRTRLKKPPLRCSIGVHSGDVFTGSLLLGGRLESAVVGPAVIGAYAAQREAMGEVRPLLLTAPSAEEVGSSLNVELLKERSVRVGREMLSLFAVAQPPPHVDYRAILDEMFGVLAPPPEEDQAGDTL